MSTDPTAVITAIIDRGDERVSVARDEVNRAMIHHLADVMEDANPLNLDADVARAAGHPDVIAPASSLQVWNMINPSDPVIESDVDTAYAVLADAGYPKVVAVNCVQEYDRPLVPGDLLTAREKVETLVGPKKTGLGEGYFITTLTTYTDQNDERVGTMRFRTLWYDPTTRSNDV